MLHHWAHLPRILSGLVPIAIPLINCMSLPASLYGAAGNLIVDLIDEGAIRFPVPRSFGGGRCYRNDCNLHLPAIKENSRRGWSNI